MITAYVFDMDDAGYTVRSLLNITSSRFKTSIFTKCQEERRLYGVCGSKHLEQRNQRQAGLVCMQEVRKERRRSRERAVNHSDLDGGKAGIPTVARSQYAASNGLKRRPT